MNLVQKLLLAAAGIDQVGMRIAERRKEHAACRIDHRVPVGRRLPGPRSEARDAPFFGRQPGIVDPPEPVHLGACKTLPIGRNDAGDRTDMGDEELHRYERIKRIERSIWG